MKAWRNKLQRHLLRPFIYMLSTRFLTALTVILALHFFIGDSLSPRFKSYACLFCGVLFALLAWIAYLRLDGVHLPTPLMKRVNIRKKPRRSYGDIIDYVDEEPPLDFDDLEDDEKDLCILGADLACFVIFIVLSFFL